MADLNLLDRVLSLHFDLVLHLAEVALQVFLVPLIGDLDLMQTLAELVTIPLQLQVLRTGLIQLLRQAQSEPLQHCLHVPEAALDLLQQFLVVALVKICLHIQLLIRGKSLRNRPQVLDQSKQMSLELRDFESCILYLVIRLDDVWIIGLLGQSRYAL